MILTFDPLRDADTLRYQLLEEFELTAKKRHQGLIEEIGHLRQRLHESLREFEDYKTQVHNKDRDYQGTLEDLAAAHQQEMLVLNLRLKEKAALAGEFELVYELHKRTI